MNIYQQLEKKVIDNFIKLGIDNTKKILVALSGGPDSVFLTIILSKYFHKSNIFCYHINHKIRPAEETKADENFIIKFCEDNEMDLIVSEVDIPTIAKEEKKSIETVAREIRYSLFFNFMQKESIDQLATAHTADDQIETFFQRLFRGAGFQGFSCIPEQRKIDLDEYTSTLFRPLLNIRKFEILEYLNSNKIEYCIDKTNFENFCERNKIRNLLLPFIDNNFNKTYTNNIFQFIELNKKANIFFQQHSEKLLKEIIIKKETDKIIISQKKILELSEIECSYILSNILKLLSYDASSESWYGLESKHIKYLQTFLTTAQSGKKIDLIENIRIYKEFDNIIFIKRENSDAFQKKYDFLKEIFISDIPIIFELKNFIIEIFFLDSLSAYISSNEDIQKTNAVEKFFRIDISSDINTIIFRNLKNTDRIKLRNSKIHKKIKNIFSEKKIPISERSNYFAIEINDLVVAAPFLVNTENECDLTELMSSPKLDINKIIIIKIKKK